MPISDKYGLVFVHIPKNAGTTIQKCLEMRAIGHHPWQVYQKAHCREWQAYKSFAIFRDPIDRFVSCYNYARQDSSYWHSSVASKRSIYGKHPDFEVCCAKSINEVVDLLLGRQIALRHQGWIPQHSWINNNGMVGVDFLVDFMKIDSAMRIIAPLAKIDAKLNQSLGPARHDLTSKSILDLERFYRIDFDLLRRLRSVSDGILRMPAELCSKGIPNPMPHSSVLSSSPPAKT
jgi:hypothetical protein